MGQLGHEQQTVAQWFETVLAIGVIQILSARTT